MHTTTSAGSSKSKGQMQMKMHLPRRTRNVPPKVCLLVTWIRLLEQPEFGSIRARNTLLMICHYSVYSTIRTSIDIKRRCIHASSLRVLVAERSCQLVYESWFESFKGREEVSPVALSISPDKIALGRTDIIDAAS